MDRKINYIGRKAEPVELPVYTLFDAMPILMQGVNELMRGLDDSIIDGVSSFQLGSREWWRLRNALVSYGLGLEQQTFGDLIPTLKELEACSFETRDWLPSGVAGLQGKVRYSLLESGIKNVTDLAPVRIVDAYKFRFFDKLMMHTLLGFLIEIGVSFRIRNQGPSQRAVSDVSSASAGDQSIADSSTKHSKVVSNTRADWNRHEGNIESKESVVQNLDEKLRDAPVNLSFRILLGAFPTLMGGVDDSVFEGVVYFKLGSEKWLEARDALVAYGLSLQQQLLGELMPSLKEMTDYDFRTQTWLPYRVEPIQSRIKNALFEEGIKNVSDLAALRVVDVQLLAGFGDLTVRALLGFLIELAVAARPTSQKPFQTANLDKSSQTEIVTAQPIDRSVPDFEILVEENQDDTDLQTETQNFQVDTEKPEGDLTLLDDLNLLAKWEIYRGKGATLGQILDYTSKGYTPPEVEKAALRLLATDLNSLTPKIITVVELIDEILNTLAENQHYVITRRILSPNPLTLDQVGQELGVTRERARQIQKRIERMIYHKLAHPHFVPIRWVAAELRVRLGDLAPAEHPLTIEVIEELLPGERAPYHVQMLLRLANYETSEGWLTTTSLDRTKHLLDNLFAEAADEFGLLPEGHETEVLTQAGVNPEFYDVVLTSFSRIFKRSGRFVLWQNSVVDKAVTILALRGEPADMSTIISEIGESYSVAGARDRLRADPRIVRVSKTEYGLRIWGHEEYSGISEEIVERIKRGGGEAKLESVVSELVTTFDVAENSVRIYCSAPMFVIENGTIRIRSAGEQQKFSEDLSRVKGAYKKNLHEVCLLILIDKEVLRGSGRLIVPSLTAALQVNPGQERTYRGRDGNVRITWPPNQAMGGSRGSVQNIAVSLGAKDGDRLLFVFNTAQLTVDYRLVNENIVREGPSLQAVAELTGIRAENVEEAKSRLAEALGVGQTLLKKTLVDRGDAEVASALPEKELTDDVARALAEFANLFQKE